MRWCCGLLACGCALGWVAGAQNVPAQQNIVLTQQGIEAKLAGPFLILRDQYEGDRLKYDARGKLHMLAGVMPLSLSAIRLDSVRLDGDSVVIRGTREGLEFTPAGEDGERLQVQAAPWDPNARVEITIRIDPRHPEQVYSALDRIFTAGLNDVLAAAAPDYWQPWLRHDLHPGVEADRLIEVAEQNALPCQSEGVTPPRLLQSVIPAFSDQARMVQYQGTEVLHMTVDATGRPGRIFIWRPLGMGLDERAVEAERREVFSPAMRDGEPVACGLNVVAHFNADGTVN